jgi:hypothetical protein
MEHAYDEALQHGMKVARVQMDWPDVEPELGVYNKAELRECFAPPFEDGHATSLLLCSADSDALNYPRDLLAPDGRELADGMGRFQRP